MDKNTLKEIVVNQQKRRTAPKPYVTRLIGSELMYYFSNQHAVIVKGVRRCGKSTLLNQALEEQTKNQYYYLNFEDERLLSFTVEDFNKLYEVMVEIFGERKIFYFDEIQNIEHWETYVRRMQD